MKDAKKIAYYTLSAFETVFIAFVAILAIINTVMFFQLKVLDYPVPRVLGYSFINILSGSMEPTASAGDLVIFKEQDSYSVNDPVLFEEQGFLIFHRIVEANEDGSFITKGDANNINDKAEIQPQNVYGKMAWVLHGWGSTLSYLSSRMGALWTILATLFIYLTLDMGKELLKEEAEKNIVEKIEEENAAQTEIMDIFKTHNFEDVYNEIIQKRNKEVKKNESLCSHNSNNPG